MLRSYKILSLKQKLMALACVGDEIDVPQLGAFNKGTRAEFERTLQRDFNTAHNVLGRFQGSPWIKEEAIYLATHQITVSALKSTYTRMHQHLNQLQRLRIENLLGLNKLRITYQRQMDFIAPGVLLAHGDEGRMFQNGLMAVNLGIRTGQNVVCGHSHRQSIAKSSRGFAGRLNTIWGMEVGHLMDTRSSGANYIKEKSMNWQQGFAVLYVEGNHVVPQLVPINDKGKFIVDGKEWG
jgi:hypothetical protein